MMGRDTQQQTKFDIGGRQAATVDHVAFMLTGMQTEARRAILFEGAMVFLDAMEKGDHHVHARRSPIFWAWAKHKWGEFEDSWCAGNCGDSRTDFFLALKYKKDVTVYFATRYMAQSYEYIRHQFIR